MFTSSAAPVPPRARRASHQGPSRAALSVVGTLAMLLASTRTSAAQTSAPEASTWELRATSGAFVPTGNQRNFLRDAQVTAAQASWVVRPSLVGAGTSNTRNDVVIMAGLRFNRHRASQD